MAADYRHQHEAQTWDEVEHMNDPANDWRGCEWSIRQMPRHWTLTDPDEHWDTAREFVWLVVKTVAAAALVVALYAAVAQ